MSSSFSLPQAIKHVFSFFIVVAMFLVFSLLITSDRADAQQVLNQVNTAFNAFDVNRNGLINHEEAITGWAAFKQAFNTSPAIGSSSKKWDIDNSGRIDFGDMSSVAQVINQSGMKPIIDLMNQSQSTPVQQAVKASAFCGNGRTEGSEQCDDGNRQNTDRCTNACVISRCGDKILQPILGERCDDGNTNNNDACTNQCQRR